jgi:hypothetical protein
LIFVSALRKRDDVAMAEGDKSVHRIGSVCA